MEKNNFKEIKRVLWIIMFANIIIAFIKIVIGTFANSSSIVADGFHSITDGSSNIIGLIGVGIAAKPIDEEHPYGHKKYETLTGLFIVGMLVFIGGKIIIDGINKFMHPVRPEITTISLIVMLVTLCINIFITKYEYKKGLELKSTILISDSMHTKSDVFVTIGVIIAISAIKLGISPLIDSFASVVVAIFIFHSAYEIFRAASDILVDSIAVEAGTIKEITMSQKSVKGVHKIRSRGTIEDMHIDMHVLADSRMSLEESHKLTHEIQDALRKEFNNNADVIVHLEPYRENMNNRAT
ncbi:cation diffusion facilitator family transporter [Clostridium sp. YIM B02569]|uniref:cation diffusion facilitator family transporter n=1 Tax=Clostridium sp. YIM B02569 TaxID=2911967 RepID=UPI001EECC096|nr:cation diffusion facilitator family transporter [Clostridium sp. YIM B02569]